MRRRRHSGCRRLRYCPRKPKSRHRACLPRLQLRAVAKVAPSEPARKLPVWYGFRQPISRIRRWHGCDQSDEVRAVPQRVSVILAGGILLLGLAGASLFRRPLGGGAPAGLKDGDRGVLTGQVPMGPEKPAPLRGPVVAPVPPTAIPSYYAPAGSPQCPAAKIPSSAIGPRQAVSAAPAGCFGGIGVPGEGRSAKPGCHTRPLAHPQDRRRRRTAGPGRAVPRRCNAMAGTLGSQSAGPERPRGLTVGTGA